VESLRKISDIVDSLIGKYGSDKTLDLISSFDIDLDSKSVEFKILKYLDFLVCQHFSLTDSKMYIHSTKIQYSEPRSIAMFVANTKANISINKLARHYDKDKSSISRSITKIDGLCQNKKYNIKLNSDIETLTTKFENYLINFLNKIEDGRKA